MHQIKTVRFWRRGGWRYPVYDIVVARGTSRGRGFFVERLGYYNPQSREKRFVFNGRRLGFWLNRGAQLHYKVARQLPFEYVATMVSRRKAESSHG